MLEILKILLKDRELSFYQLSKMTGIPTGVLSSFNTGRVKTLSFQNMIKIADALEISLDIFRDNTISGRKIIFNDSQLKEMLAEFLDQMDDSVPEQQGGYDLNEERWLSGSERIERFINHDCKILNKKV